MQHRIRNIFLFSFSFNFPAVFVLFYILNGVFGERAFEVFAFVIGTFIVLLYCIINYANSPGKDVENIIKLVSRAAVQNDVLNKLVK